MDDDGLHALGLIGHPGQGTIGDDRLPAIVLDRGLVADADLAALNPDALWEPDTYGFETLGLTGRPSNPAIANSGLPATLLDMDSRTDGRPGRDRCHRDSGSDVGRDA